MTYTHERTPTETHRVHTTQTQCAHALGYIPITKTSKKFGVLRLQPLRLSQGVTHFVDTQYLLKICPC